MGHHHRVRVIEVRPGRARHLSRACLPIYIPSLPGLGGGPTRKEFP